MRKYILAALFTAAVLVFATATAFSFERVVQDDETFVYGWHGDSGSQLEDLKRAGVTTIRINVLHVRGREPINSVWGTDTGGGVWGLTAHADMPAYDAAVTTILAHGLKVQMTLVWYGQSDPYALKDWMSAVARHFADRVMRFSILNEPDLTLHEDNACTPRELNRMLTQGVLKPQRIRKIVYKRLSRKQLKHFKGRRYRKLKRRTSTGKRKVVYKRSKKGRYRRIKRWRIVVHASSSSYMEQYVSLRTGCMRVKQGRKYRRVVQIVAPAIRNATPPGTQVMAGETSPAAGVLLFISAAVQGGLPVDGWLHHPYYGNEGGIENCPAVTKAAGMPLGFSEFGFRSEWPDRANALKHAWQKAVDCGAFQMAQYQVNTPVLGTWNTSLAGDFSLLEQANPR
jgi:hypothetical protein